MSDPNRILGQGELALAEATATAEQLRAMLQIAKVDAERHAFEVADFALKMTVENQDDSAFQLYESAQRLAWKIGDMLRDAGPQVDELQAREAMLQRERSGAVQH